MEVEATSSRMRVIITAAVEMPSRVILKIQKDLENAEYKVAEMETAEVTAEPVSVSVDVVVESVEYKHVDVRL